MCQLIIHSKNTWTGTELSSQFYKLLGDEWSVESLERDKPYEARLVPPHSKALDP